MVAVAVPVDCTGGLATSFAALSEAVNVSTTLGAAGPAGPWGPCGPTGPSGPAGPSSPVQLQRTATASTAREMDVLTNPGRIPASVVESVRARGSHVTAEGKSQRWFRGEGM